MASSRVVGLDIGTTGVRAVETVTSGGRKGTTQVVRLGVEPLPLGAVRDGEVQQPEVVARALRQLWSRTKFSSRDVAIGVGNQRVLVRDLDVPAMPLAQIKAGLAFQVQDLLPMSVDEALLDFHPTGEFDSPQGRMVRGMLVAAQRDTVTANVMAVESAGLHPRVVDLNAFALVRAFARGPYAEEILGLVDVGANLTTIVVAAAGQPRIVRTIAAGGHDVTNALTSHLGIAAPEAEMLKREVGVGFALPAERHAAGEIVGDVTRTLVEAIRNTFVYYSGNHPGAPISGVILTGGGGHLNGFGQYLASATRLPVMAGDALASMALAKSVDPSALGPQAAMLALSVGLSQGSAA